MIHTLGNEEILNSHKTAFFCSQKCPPGIITRIYDLAIELRDKGKTVISGFHTRIEKEVLTFLLKGKQPIIICPARSLRNIRMRPEIKKAFDKDRILFLSPFGPNHNRMTSTLSNKRNQFIAEIADEIFIVYAEQGGKLEQMAKQLSNLKKELRTINDLANTNLIQMGFTFI